jgi:hypothetical protein
MSYTQLNDERIDKKIDQELEIVCEEILKVIKPVSIILFGGFGRGEGGAQVKDGEVILSKDYDTLLVVKEKLPPSVIYHMSANIHRRLGRTNPLDSATMEMGSGVSLVQYTLNDLLYFRDAKTYEIKAASKLLWGEDIRERIPLKAEDLSPWNGIRFLLRKPPGLCGSFSPEYLNSSPAGEAKETLIHECSRVYLDGGVLLTVLAKTYQPTYCQRARVIKESLASSLPHLAEKLPDLANKIEFFTDLKISPNGEKYGAIEPVKLWFETRKDLGIILKYFMEHHLGENTEGWAELFDRYSIMMNSEFVDELAYFYLKKRFRIASKPLARLANIAYQRLFCLKYVLKLRKKESILYLRALNEFPTFKVCTSGLMLLFSLNEDGSLDKDLFNSFIQSLGQIYPMKIQSSTDENRWKEAVDDYIRADRTFLDTFYGWG